VPEVFPGGKGGWCVRLTTLPPSCAVVMKSGNLNFLEPSEPLQARKIYIYIYTHTHTHTHTNGPFVVTNEQFNSHERIKDPSEKMRLKVGRQNTPKTAIEVTRRREGWLFFNGWFMNPYIKNEHLDNNDDNDEDEVDMPCGFCGTKYGPIWIDWIKCHERGKCNKYYVFAVHTP